MTVQSRTRYILPKFETEANTANITLQSDLVMARLKAIYRGQQVTKLLLL